MSLRKTQAISSYPFKLLIQIFLPYQSLYGPTHNMLNATPQKKQDEMLQDWKEKTLFELNFIGIVVRPSTSPLPFSCSFTTPSSVMPYKLILTK